MQKELGEKFDSCNVLNLARRVEMICLQTQSNKEYQLKESYPYKGAVAEWSKMLLARGKINEKPKGPRFAPWPGQSLKKVFQTN